MPHIPGDKTKGHIFIHGLGNVRIEGDTPTEEELDIIAENANLFDPEDEGDPFVVPPQTGLPEGQTPGTVPGSGGRSGPISNPPIQGPQDPFAGPVGLFPRDIRRSVRTTIEEQPGLAQFLAEMAPSAGGTLAGIAMGAPGGPFAMAAGGIIGGFLGELGGQETGIAPTSKLNLGLAATGPLVGEGLGQAFRAGRFILGRGFAKGFPAARVARARNLMGQAASQFESVGTSILSKTKGLASRSADDLFTAARRAKVRIPPERFKRTRDAIEETLKELDDFSEFDDFKQSIAALTKLKNVILNNPDGILLEKFITARSIMGKASATAKGQKLKTVNKMFATLSQDLEDVAKSPFRKGRQARLALEGIKRAKLEFAVEDIQDAVARFSTQSEKVPGGVVLNVKGLNKWFSDITNPAIKKKFDKNLVAALGKENITHIKSQLKAMDKLVAATGSPAGPGSIVVRGQLAKIGRGMGGAALGFLGTGGSATGAAVGGLIAAQFPEIFVGMLTSRPGAAFLERAAKAGAGDISHRAWQAGTQLMMRGMGETGAQVPVEKVEEEEPPSEPKPKAARPRGRGQTKEAPVEEPTPGGDVTIPKGGRTRRRLPADFK